MTLNIVSPMQYYYSRLTGTEKRIYDRLLDGLSQYCSSIVLNTGSTETVKRVFEMVSFDNPKLFYVTSLRYVETQMGALQYISVHPEYRFGRGVIETLLAEMEDRITSICRGWQYLSEEEKEHRVHSYLVHNVEYDYTFNEASYVAAGPLLYGKGVCEGIAKAAKQLFDYVHIKSMIVTGRKIDKHANANDELHAWNIVWLGRKPYHLDITFDRTIMINHTERFDYYNLSDFEIGRDHIVQSLYAPVCSAEYAYYKRKQLFMDTPAELAALIRGNCSEKGKDVVFKLPYNTDFGRMKDKAAEVIQMTLRRYSSVRSMDLLYNESQCVFQLCFR